MKVILFPEGSNICEIYITGDLSLEETAKKDVPAGTKYKIVDEKDLPEDRTFRDAWEYDFSKDFDGIGVGA
tara:strand:+ start:762 stop:974 length:213 start_codon:yes stop_codon:yes gene_type:complete